MKRRIQAYFGFSLQQDKLSHKAINTNVGQRFDGINHYLSEHTMGL